jgi:hypothetical protein
LRRGGEKKVGRGAGKEGGGEEEKDGFSEKGSLEVKQY